MKNFKFIDFLLLIFCLWTLQNTFSQIKNIGIPDINNYTKSQYKGGTQNWDIDQDRNGNLYFANNNGLFQFDGSSWRKYSIPNSSSIRCLKIDSSGKIFVGGYSEFGYFKSDLKGRLVYYSLSEKINKTESKVLDFIWKIHILNGEVIFQSFAKAYSFKNNAVKILEAPKRFQFSFMVNNKIYFQDASLGILVYKQGKLIALKGTSVLNSTEIWGMFPMDSGHILIATLDKGLYIYNNEKIIAWNTEANNFIKKNSALGGIKIKNKFIVLNSVLNGIIICDLKSKIIQHINRNKGLQNNTILSSFIDKQNNLWLGLDNGIAFINENSPFTYFGFSYNISTVYASVIHNGNLYVATNQGVFFHLWEKPFKEENFKLVEGTTGQAWNIQIIDNQIFCSHNRGALLIIDNKISQILDTKGYWVFKPIPKNPNYLIGSNYNGFAIFHKDNGIWKFKNQIQGYNNSTNPFELDDDYIWFKKDDLAYQITLSDDFKNVNTIKTYNNISDTVKGIGSIQKIKKTLYFQSNNHFYKYSQQQDSFFEDKKMTSIFAKLPIIRSVKEDNYGNIWYFFNESMGVLTKDKNEYKNHLAPFSNLTANLVHYYENVNTIDNNNIFIGLTDGLAHYDPNFSTHFTTKPKAFIRSFLFPSDSLLLGNGQHKIDKYKIPYRSNHVKFTFSSPTFENHENVEYSYQLDFFDDKWSNWSTIALKEYTNLREGDYKMKLKVRNSYGIQSDPTFVEFTILPPWYRHFLAYLLYILLITASIHFIRQRTKMKIRKNKYYQTIEQRKLYLEKEAKIRQEQYQLEKEIEKLENDKLQIKILSKDKELVTNTLQVVKKNKILNGIIAKLKDINVELFDESTKLQFSKLNKSIVKEVNTDKSWKDLEKHIKNVHFDFLKRLKEKHPSISPRELDLSTYLLMNMSTKEIAEFMNISNGGVELARYRLRKKLNLTKKENLIGYLLSI